MRTTPLIVGLICQLSVAAFICIAAGCAPTRLTTTSEYAGPLPQPGLIVVENFAVSPDEVTLDSGIVSEIEQARSGAPRTQEELAIGRKIATAFATDLVSRLQSQGIPPCRQPMPISPTETPC